jgi:predicted Zn-dependent protease
MTSRAVFGLILSSLWVSGAVAQDSKPPSPPTEKETALGRSLATEIEAKAAPLDDAVVVEFVQNVAQKLAEVSGTEPFLKVRVLDSPDAVAHALPGGFLLVRSGLVAGSETTAELAGVLAHQIAHIAAGHGWRDAPEPPRRSTVSNVPMIFLGGSMGICTRVPGPYVVPQGWLKRVGRQEEEADLLALEYLDRAGYAPNALVDAFDRLGAEGIPETSRMTSAVRDKAHEYSSSGRTYIATSPGFNEIRERLPKPSPKQQVENAPSLLRPGER